VNVGGNMYQKLGVMAPYFTDRGNVTKAGPGALQRHRRSTGHVHVQGSEPAECRTDRALLS
jgi:hypothetical protein